MADISDIYILYAGAAGMLLHINGQFTMGKLISYLFVVSFVLTRPSLSMYEADLHVSVPSLTLHV